jgi:hypothetical protein
VPVAVQPPPPAEPEAQVTAEEPAAAVEEPAVEEPESAPAEVAPATARGNGYPPAERQAESLAAASESEPEPEPEPEERTVVRAAAPQDGGMVPTRRRGLMRRLFAK